MRREVTVDVADRKVTVRELTVAEVRAWLHQADGDGVQPDPLAEMLIEQMSFGDIARMSDLPLADMDALAPSELQQVADKCRELNQHFFEMSARVRRIAGSGNS